MTDEQKVHELEELPREAEELSPEEAQPAQGGSATGGAGAGKIKFNEFTIKKTSD